MKMYQMTQLLLTDTHADTEKKGKKKNEVTREVEVNGDSFENISGSAIVVTGGRKIITKGKK